MARQPKPAITWRWFWTTERGYNPQVRSACAGQNGCYAFRDGESREVVYVGESHSGRLWKTALRHFQGIESGKFEDRREWVWSERDMIEVQVWTTRTGEQAQKLERQLIDAYNPSQQSLSTIPDFDLIMGRRSSQDEEEELQF